MVVFVMSLFFICMDMLECKRGIILENFKWSIKENIKIL